MYITIIYKIDKGGPKMLMPNPPELMSVLRMPAVARLDKVAAILSDLMRQLMLMNRYERQHYRGASLQFAH
jgi:hypothetical protein